MNNLLLNEHPLIILPSLAEKIGLNEAIVLQQLHYWIKDSQKFYDGHKWTYNTYDGWQKQFPFWSTSTIRRTLTNLEQKKLVITGNYNKLPIDKTKWYTINYAELKSMSSPSVQNEQSICSKWTDPSVQNEQTITLDLPKTSTESSSSENPFHFYQQNFGVINPFIADELQDWCNDLGDALVIEAMKKTLENQKKWGYCKGILKDWYKNNIRTLEDVESQENEFKRKRELKNGKRQAAATKDNYKSNSIDASTELEGIEW